MAITHLYYATNRHHLGRNSRKPTGYGIEPSRDGTENLRFGLVIIPSDDRRVAESLQEDCGVGTGNGEKLAEYFFGQRGEAIITAVLEHLLKEDNETNRDGNSVSPERFRSYARK